MFTIYPFRRPLPFLKNLPCLLSAQFREACPKGDLEGLNMDVHIYYSDKYTILKIIHNPFISNYLQ
jgi:hypothetical protein